MNPTSLNMSLSIFNEIHQAGIKFNISKKDIIYLIFRYCHNNFNFNNFQYGKLTAYQKKLPDDSWKCFRIDFTETQCDVYFLHRNNYRISLSKLLAVGFYLFFDKILSELSQNEKTTKIEFSNSYTDLKRKLLPFVKNSFKYFNIKAKTIP